MVTPVCTRNFQLRSRKRRACAVQLVLPTIATANEEAVTEQPRQCPFGGFRAAKGILAFRVF
jgi:hypothetical protein